MFDGLDRLTLPAEHFEVAKAIGELSGALNQDASPWPSSVLRPSGVVMSRS